MSGTEGISVVQGREEVKVLNHRPPRSRVNAARVRFTRVETVTAPASWFTRRAPFHRANTTAACAEHAAGQYRDEDGRWPQ